MTPDAHALLSAIGGPAPWAPVRPLLALGMSTVGLGLGFVALMAGAGFVLGRFMGSKERLIDQVNAGRHAANNESRELVQAVITAITNGDTSDQIGEVLKALTGPASVDDVIGPEVFAGLLGAVGSLRSGDEAARLNREQVLRVLARIAVIGSDHTRMRVLGAMVRALPRNRHVTPFLIEICKRVPEAWNDVQPALEEALASDPSVAKYMRDAAGPKEPFVRQATELYMTSMVRFRRLCEDRAAGSSVDAELIPILEREFTFLHLAGTVSRRFVWLSAQARRFHPMINDERVDILLGEAASGQSEVHALLGQLALNWALEGLHEARVRRILAGLEDAAKHHPSAGDALLDVFLGLKSNDVGNTRPDREAVRRRAYFALLAAADHSFEVIKLLGTHGIPRDLYQGGRDSAL